MPTAIRVMIGFVLVGGGQRLKKASKTCLSRGTKAEELAIVSPWGVISREWSQQKWRP